MKNILSSIHYALPDLRTPLGRMLLRRRVFHNLRPILDWYASCYRKAVLKRTRIVVVVGSLGKTTTRRAVAAALDVRLGWRAAANANSGADVAREIYVIKPSRAHGVIEVSVGGPNQMQRYARMIKPDIVVVTSIASEHMRTFGTLEVTRAEKVKMAKSLSASGIAVLNGDDPHVVWMKTQITSKIVTFGLAEHNDVWATDIVLDWPRGMKFTLRTKAGAWPMATKLLGRHMLYSVLAAIAVGITEGVAIEDIIKRLEAFTTTPGRMEAILLDCGAYLLRDDYKSTLETIHASIDALDMIPSRRKIVVLGDVSERPGTQRKIYGGISRRLAAIASEIIVVNSSTTSFECYATPAVRAGFPERSMHYTGKGVVRAISYLKQILRQDDVVLVKGRDTQRLERISLALQGREVRCDLQFCQSCAARCDTCPQLEHGFATVKTHLKKW